MYPIFRHLVRKWETETETRKVYNLVLPATYDKRKKITIDPKVSFLLLYPQEIRSLFPFSLPFVPSVSKDEREESPLLGSQPSPFFCFWEDKQKIAGTQFEIV